jgi:hypothetical protein
MRFPNIFKKITKDRNLEPYKQVSTFTYNNASKSPKGMRARNETLNGMRTKGYELDPELSDRETSVFYNPTTKHTIVGYRGTDLGDSSTRMKDLKSDFNILIGKTRNDQRFREADEKYKAVKTKYGDHKIDVTGHSLGGALAKHVNDRHSNEIDKSVAFSRGSSPFHVQKKQSNQIDVSNMFDPISMGARLEGGQQIVDTAPRNALDAHSLSYL